MRVDHVIEHTAFIRDEGGQWFLRPPLYRRTVDGVNYPVYDIRNGGECTAPTFPDDYVRDSEPFRARGLGEWTPIPGHPDIQVR